MFSASASTRFRLANASNSEPNAIFAAETGTMRSNSAQDSKPVTSLRLTFKIDVFAFLHADASVSNSHIAMLTPISYPFLESVLQDGHYIISFLRFHKI